MREVNKSQLNKDLTRKSTDFERWPWFKLNNFGRALPMALKFRPVWQKG